MPNELIKPENNPQSLIALAIEKGSSIEQLEKLMLLKERYDAIEANKEFLSAMSNFQKDVPTIEKKKLVSFGNTKYKYAELGEIDETIKTAMAANGLSKRWEINEQGDKLFCTCIISHIDGHLERTTMSSTKDSTGSKNGIQSMASAISYLQRYTLIGALGLTTASEDDDAQGTSEVSNVKNNKTYTHVNNTEKQKEETVISGAWYAKMEKCKSKREVLEVYKANKLTVDADPGLQKLLKDTQNSFYKG